MIVAALWLSGVLGGRSGPQIIGGHPLLDRPAPAFVLQDLDGRQVSLADFRGRPLLVYFWASWCLPCRTEFPLIKSALAAHAGEGLAALGIVFKDSSTSAAQFMSAQGATWPALVDPDGAVAAAYAVSAPPMTFYVDRAGIVRTISFGPPPAGSLEGLLAKILPSPTAP